MKKTGLSILFVALLMAASAAYFFRPVPVEASPDFASLQGDAEAGAYLAMAGNCSACHTTSGNAAYAGGVAFHTDFGKIYSTNITASPTQGIGDWSFEDFHRAMRHGIRPDGTHLYPAFPYTHFAGLKDDDIASLFLHFRTIAPVDEETPANQMDFPFGERRLMHFWKRLYHEPSRSTVNAGKSDEWNRGAYLVESVAHCGACHSPRNALGGLEAGRPLAGGTYFDEVANGQYRTWSAVDLTPSKHGLARWSKADIVEYLQTGINDHVVVHGPMNEVVLGSTSKMAKADLQAIATYLTDIESTEAPIDWPLVGGDYDLGETVYTVHCGTCHLPDGEGDPTLGVPLGGNPIVQSDDAASFINVVLYGPQLPPPPFSVPRTRMKPFGKRLSDEDIAAVATYVRNSFGNNASSVSADQVAAQR